MWENVILHEIDSIYQRDISRFIISGRMIYLLLSLFMSLFELCWSLELNNYIALQSFGEISAEGYWQA